MNTCASVWKQQICSPGCHWCALTSLLILVGRLIGSLGLAAWFGRLILVVASPSTAMNAAVYFWHALPNVQELPASGHRPIGEKRADWIPLIDWWPDCGLLNEKNYSVYSLPSGSLTEAALLLSLLQPPFQPVSPFSCSTRLMLSPVAGRGIIPSEAAQCGILLAAFCPVHRSGAEENWPLSW